MKIDDLISKLNELKTNNNNNIDGNTNIVFVCPDGENDIYDIEYAITGNTYQDCDNNEYKTAFIISRRSEEFTKRGIPHYEWKCYEDRV